jgi:hypothetical protein
LGVIADAFDLAQFAVGHEVEFVAVFGEPDGGIHGDTGFPEGGEADITLALNFGGDGRHADIVKRGGFLWGVRAYPNYITRFPHVVRGSHTIADY